MYIYFYMYARTHTTGQGFAIVAGYRILKLLVYDAFSY